MTNLTETIDLLLQIEKDSTVPKNVRSKVKIAISILENQSEQEMDVKINKVLQELEEISEDPNTPIYTRTQIWNIVSSLESIK